MAGFVFVREGRPAKPLPGKLASTEIADKTR